MEKKAVKSKVSVQWLGKSFDQEQLLKLAKASWTKEYKKKAGDLVKAELYVKVEENKLYYVMNGTDGGSVVLPDAQ